MGGTAALLGLVAAAATAAGAGVAGASKDKRLPTSLDLAQDLTSSSVASQASTALDGLDLDAIVAFRLRRVREYASLGVFPPSYHPLAGDSRRIYAPITPKAKWLGPTPYYVANPYVLIVLTSANHVTPLNLICPEVRLRHVGAAIEERRSGAGAACWFRWLYEPSYAEHPGAIRLVMVNAYDAGLRFAHVDRSRSVNLKDDAQPDNVMRGLFSQSSLFHVGKYGANNISPEDPRGWVRLARRGARTRIFVKLWRQAPADVSRAPDFAYDVVVEP